MLNLSNHISIIKHHNLLSSCIMIRWHIVKPLQIRRHTNWAYLPQTSYKILTSQRMLSSLAFPGTPLKLSGNLSGSGNKAETNQQSFNIKFLLNSLHIFFYNIIRRIISLIKTIPNTDHLITGPGESPVLSFFSRNFTKTSQFSEWNNINFFGIYDTNAKQSRKQHRSV